MVVRTRNNGGVCRVRFAENKINTASEPRKTYLRSGMTSDDANETMRPIYVREPPPSERGVSPSHYAGPTPHTSCSSSSGSLALLGYMVIAD